MLRFCEGDVGECEGRGIWRTDIGVGMGVVETDMPRSVAAGRDGEEASCALPSVSLPLPLPLPLLLAIVWRIVSWGVL